MEKNGDHCSMRIDGEMTIYTALLQKQGILQMIRECIVDARSAIEVDLSQISDFDTAGVQLLIMAHKEAATNGHKLYLGELSKAVAEVLDLYHIRSMFAMH